MESKLYYLIEKRNWTLDGSHKGSPLDLSDGFIHLSAKSHLEHVTRKFFSGKRDVLLITLEADKLDGTLEWIQSKSTGGYFAHLFGVIPQSAVLSIQELENDKDGFVVLSKNIGQI